jgi:hypothetical protein
MPLSSLQVEAESRFDEQLKNYTFFTASEQAILTATVSF